MALHAAAREILDRCFGNEGWRRVEVAWSEGVFALTDLYIDAWQHGFIVRSEELREWAQGRGWPREDINELLNMAYTVHTTLIRAGVITR